MLGKPALAGRKMVLLGWPRPLRTRAPSRRLFTGMTRRTDLARLLLVGIVLIGLSLALVAGLVKAKRALFGDDAPPAARACDVRPKNIRAPSRPPAPAGAWQAIPSSPLARAEAGGVALGDRIYLAGGQGESGRSSDELVSYQPASGRYRSEPAMPARVDHPLVTTDGRDLYVVGGYTDSEPVDTAFRYSTEQRRWERLPSMRVARGGLGGGIVDGRLYAVSGAPRTWPNEYVKSDDTVEVLDLATRRWSFGPPLPLARHHLGTATFDGAIYIVGGRNADDFAIARVDRLDPRTNRWESVAPLPQGVAAPLVASTRRGLVVAGGADPERWESDALGWVTPATWAYEARRDRWRRLPDLDRARHQGVAGAVGGSVYVFEGSPCPGFGRLRSAERLRLDGAA